MRSVVALTLLVAVAGPGLSAQTLRERVRAFALEHPDAVYRFPRAPVDFPGPQTIDGIAREADAVVHGKLTKGNTRLVADDVIVTDYTISEPALIVGRLPVQQTSRPGTTAAALILSLWGGKMVLDGVPVEAEGGYAPKVGSTYILFLRPARQSTLPNNFELHAEGIFEIDGARVNPLFRDAVNVFRGTLDQDVNAFTARIRNAARAR